MDEFISIFISELLESGEQLASTRRQQRAYPAVDIYDLSETEVIKNFRLNKDLIRVLIHLLAPVIQETTKIDLQTKHDDQLMSLLQTLINGCPMHFTFLGTGSYQTPTGNLNKINVSQATTSRCIRDVVEALNHPNIFHEWVRFPRTLQELQTIALDFYNCYRFPGVIGCMDCTHVAIVPPPGTTHDERSYVNRKNFHSINTQLICDSKLKILNVKALFPGSTHDSYIWSNSAVLPLLHNLHNAGYTNYHLLGDSGYPLRPWCLTPILNLEEDDEENTPAFLYNEALKKTRSTIERCNGVLKGRFRCFIKDRVLHYTPNKATKIINACCVLHNLCIAHNFELTDMPEERELGIINLDPLPTTGGNIYLNLGRQKQQNIINNYFS